VQHIEVSIVRCIQLFDEVTDIRRLIAVVRCAGLPNLHEAQTHLERVGNFDGRLQNSRAQVSAIDRHQHHLRRRSSACSWPNHHNAGLHFAHHVGANAAKQQLSKCGTSVRSETPQRVVASLKNLKYQCDFWV